MEQLVLVAIIVGFSILEAIARRKRQGQGGPGEGAPPMPGEWGEEPQARPGAHPIPSYDEDPSFDDAVEGPAGVATKRGPPTVVGGERTRVGAGSSEDLIPRDIWEEIAALARGETPSAPRREPAEPPPERMPPRRRGPRRVPAPRGVGTPGEVRRPRGVRTPAEKPSRDREPHPVHATHPLLGRPISERLTPPVRGPSSALPPSEEVAAVRRLLAGGGASLRQAVILHEILGPPASQRGEPRDPDV